MQIESTEDGAVIALNAQEIQILRRADEVLYSFMLRANDTNSNPQERKAVDEARKVMAQLGNY